jgi:hypothetical protein
MMSRKLFLVLEFCLFHLKRISNMSAVSEIVGWRLN